MTVKPKPSALPLSLAQVLVFDACELFVWALKSLDKDRDTAEAVLDDIWKRVHADSQVITTVLLMSRGAIERCAAQDALGEAFTPEQALKVLAEWREEMRRQHGIPRL